MGAIKSQTSEWFKIFETTPIIFHENRRTYYFIADFYCNEIGLVVEVDGGVHDIQKEYDEMRDVVISGMGLTVLRFDNGEIFTNIEQVLFNIQGWILEREKSQLR